MGCSVSHELRLYADMADTAGELERIIVDQLGSERPLLLERSVLSVVLKSKPFCVRLLVL